MNDSKIFVLKLGRGKGVLERSLETAEVLRGVEGGDGDRIMVVKGLIFVDGCRSG